MQDSIAKEKKWSKKWMEIMSIKRGGPTLNEKFHFQFPFCFWDDLPKASSICDCCVKN